MVILPMVILPGVTVLPDRAGLRIMEVAPIGADLADLRITAIPNLESHISPRPAPIEPTGTR